MTINVITKAGPPIYIVTSYGFTSDGGNRIIETEFVKNPLLDPPSALYAEQPVNIHGSSTFIQGNDQCGSKNKPGIAITLPYSGSDDPIETSGNPKINGSPSKQYSTENLDLTDAMRFLEKSADYRYNYNSNQTLTGMSWGNPTSTGTETPISYSGPLHIVYFDMHGDKTLKLAGGTKGAGILIVNGNLDLNGGFTWYGVIIVLGALDYTGGGEKNVTGGILSGETATVQIDVGGNAGIIYCSQVADKLKDKVSPLMMTRWRDVY